MKKIKLSVIITNYNKEQYIAQCLQSVIEQTLKGIEIIVVDDGSTDNSMRVLERYEKQHNNLKVYRQQNAGVSAARNTGLQKANGEYVTFLDADDYVHLAGYEKMYEVASGNNADMVIANIICFNEYKNWPLSYMKKLFNEKSPLIRNIAENVELHFTPSTSNKIFKREMCVLNGIHFDEDLWVGEDLLFTQQCLLVAERVIVREIPLLYYRVVDNGNNNLSKNTTITFFNQLVILQMKLKAVYIERKRLALIHTIEARQWKFFVDSIVLKGKDFSNEKLLEVIQLGNKFLSSLISCKHVEDCNVRDQLITEMIKENDYIGLENLLNILQDELITKEHVYDNEKYYYFYYRFFPRYKELLQVNNLTVVHKIEGIKLRKEILTISGYAFIENVSTKKIKKELVFYKDGATKTIQLKNSLRTDISYLFSNNTIDYNDAGFKTIEVNVRELLEEGEWKILIRLSIGKTVVEEPLRVLLAQLRNNTKHQNANPLGIRVLYKNSEATIQIRKCNYMQRTMNKYRELKRAMRYDIGLFKRREYATFFAIVAYKLFGSYFRRKKIWLIGERPDTAQDNSYHLFTYIRKEHPEIPIFYIIDKECNDYKNIKDLGNIIQFGSFKHTFYLLVCNKTINSYSETANMYTNAYKHILKYYPEWQQNKKIFIQHGVIGVSRVNHVLNKNRMGYSLFVVSSQFEKDHIVKEFGYTEDEVIVTGLARWDALQDKSKGNEILLMPTWRSWVKTKEQLMESKYWQTYMSFLQSEKLHRILEEQDLTLTFFPHYQTQKFGVEIPVSHERIKIIKQGEETVQSLLKRHRLLLTDYSTVSFDFAYMNKPVIFYQFDYDEFYSRHYNEGPIDHKKELFGARVEYEQQLLDKFMNVLTDQENDFINFYKEKFNLYVDIVRESITEKIYSYIKENS
ncbi:bifunctional glycosyltransferase/CDP-glycerol:glycerophosphate glycerophosphotransferase [Bacillus cereus group sp. MYBK77-1]|uniref:bifunctional glycosyltransferase/CDP-glycerol:glycerophosphate glycerophosphotransferase n=1 Tax=Bacillus cereus group TaxID=86661 RepID=UPI0005E301A2|nr:MULTISPECIES: glycosyltransferase [Bacillus cereus group]KXI66910.1 teichoic acid biosynthesis protein B [Bacillus cereus]CKE45447.1 capsular polysaccharide biosynthesis protein [Streptococcus pneumoniae]MCC2434144.1 CDP-glycerol glycerophosphotransferase family protein [Bacillus paranthracis]MDX5915422.1 CDP-glycerol glycerophosphotransferase family protein [Bacillus cereus group sp. BfR-BA-01026]CKE50353.1 capsular polysaccharide biosynthesis protein [Bacillus paranthracis]